MASTTTLMTEGSVWKKMVAFAIPLFIGQLFQQLYNTADSLIVGNFVSSDALAAVASSGNIIFLLTGFFGGVSAGAGVVIANYIGACDKPLTEKAVHTFISLSLLAGVFLTLLGMFFAPVVLGWVGTPDEIMPLSVRYFRIYFAGAIGFVLYNTFLGILQAAGDSKHPLYYLIISSVTNVVLDLVFIAGFGLGVGAAALATAISQFLSAILCMCCLLRINEDYRFNPRKLCLDRTMIRRIIRYGIPSGMQNSIIGFANTIVQSYINYFGAAAMAGNGVHAKIEEFAFLPISCFSLATATFIGQNIGAKRPDRVKKGSLFGVACPVIMATLIGLVMYAFAPSLIRLFDSNPETVMFGVARMRTCTLFYAFLAFSHAIAAVFRGHGRANVPMFVMLACWCVIRVSILTVAGMINRTIETVNWVYPITWMCSTATFIFYYFVFFRKHMGEAA